MTIKDLRKPDNYFGDIEPGTVFTIEGDFYMAIEPFENKEPCILFNAVNLGTGKFL